MGDSMLREEFVKRINDEWKHKILGYHYCKSKRPSKYDFGGLFFTKKDENSAKDYYCYGSVDKHGVPYVNVYDTYDECLDKEMKDTPVRDFFNKVKNSIRNTIFNIKCYFQRAKKGYCEKDLYDIDGWFLSIMPKMLRELKTKCSYVPLGDDGEIIHPFNKHNIRIPFIYRDAGFGFTCIIDNNSRNGFSGKLDMVHAGEFSFGYDCRKRSLHMMGDVYGTFTDVFIHDDNSYTVDYDDNEIKKDTLDLLIELFNKALIEYQNKNEGNCLGECQNWQQLLEKVADLFDRASYKEDDRNPYDIIKDKEKYDNYETNKHHYKAIKLKEGFELFIKYFRRLGW